MSNASQVTLEQLRKIIADACSDVLEKRVSGETVFLEAGGDSLAAVQVANQIGDQLAALRDYEPLLLAELFAPSSLDDVAQTVFSIINGAENGSF